MRLEVGETGVMNNGVFINRRIFHFETGGFPQDLLDGSQVQVTGRLNGTFRRDLADGFDQIEQFGADAGVVANSDGMQRHLDDETHIRSRHYGRPEERFEAIRQSIAATIILLNKSIDKCGSQTKLLGGTGDEDGASGTEENVGSFEHDPLQLAAESLQQSLHLNGGHGDDIRRNTVDVIETAPRPRLGHAFQDPPNG